MNDKLLKPYNPQETEDRIYALWEESGLFNPDVCIKKGVTSAHAESFSIVLPPPNVTGTLHMGHAAMLVIEDILVRYNRMRGKKTLWLPGTDHAAIATQAKVEKEIQKAEGKSRYDLGRDELLTRIEAFAGKSHDMIVSQIKKMGASVDWSREAYTLDSERSLAVRTAFKNMYDDGLIYRGHRIVNWDPKGQTTISDDEIVYKEEKTKFYYLQYGPFVIGTARPETKFGDKYVVMHPDDERYARYVHGQTIALEWINGPITATIIKDRSIDMAFGTGVMTITPWHSSIDFDIAERHTLGKEQIIDERGKLLPIAGEFAGMKITEARPKIVEKMYEKNLVAKEEEYTHNIATAERTGGIIEPQIKLQWFIGVSKKFPIKQSSIRGITAGSDVSLKEMMRAAVANGQIEIMPHNFAKIYFHWIDELRDWCISRQIWYGHRIPVWYCRKSYNDPRHVSACENPIVSIKTPSACPGCGGSLEQDPDTLDTWFSSGLWTFSTLGWPTFAHHAVRNTPGRENDFANYHPTSLLETGYDILFFWVARMILMAGYNLGAIPFEKVYLHGLVRDAKGQKMSKSLGNSIDPVVMAEKYGADASRFSLIVGNTPGTDIRLSEDKIRGYKNFANKLWNIGRFVLVNIDDQATLGDHAFRLPPSHPSEKQRAIMNELDTLIADISADIEQYRLYMAAEKLYQYIWHTFADTIIEESKESLRHIDTPYINGPRYATQWMLAEMLIRILKALHPFMPFITEELWAMVPAGTALSKKREGLIMIERW